MNKFLLATMALLLLFAANTGAQTSKKRPPVKQTSVPGTKQTVLPAKYEFHVLTSNGLGVVMVQIAWTSTNPGTIESSFSEVFKEHFGVNQNSPSKLKQEYPKIVVQFTDDDDILTLIKAVHLLRVSDKAVVELHAMTADVVRLIVPRKTTAKEIVKRNPLTLIVEMTDRKNLTLNNEKMGNLSDMSALVKFLQDIFRQRRDNAVFRENTYDIEKTVLIKIPLTGKAADLIKIARALGEAGADIIGFQVDEEEATESWDLIDLPVPKIIPPKKKPIR